jgi:Fe-S cluster assembly ATP-binding protein
MAPEDRSRLGLFLSFQSPIEVPGVSNTDFLRLMCNERRKVGGPGAGGTLLEPGLAS